MLACAGLCLYLAWRGLVVYYQHQAAGLADSAAGRGICKYNFGVGVGGGLGGFGGGLGGFGVGMGMVGDFSPPHLDRGFRTLGIQNI